MIITTTVVMIMKLTIIIAVKIPWPVEATYTLSVKKQQHYRAEPLDERSFLI